MSNIIEINLKIGYKTQIKNPAVLDPSRIGIAISGPGLGFCQPYPNI